MLTLCEDSCSGAAAAAAKGLNGADGGYPGAAVAAAAAVNGPAAGSRPA